ncbi:MAG: type II toxin-antitoxin system PemK/MazF family toxin [Rhizobium sp.]
MYLANLDPVRGSEQAGTRPVIVISTQMMNVRSMRVIVCPITGNMQPWMTKIALPDGLRTRGMVLADQIRAIDKKERMLRWVEEPPNFLLLVRSYVGRLLDLEVPFVDR